MALYLVQHGKNLPKDQDPDQGLSPEGKFTVERMAFMVRDHGVRVSRIIHSDKVRARQTARIIGVIMGPPQGVEEQPGLGPLDEVAPVAATLSAKDNLMLVGHLPFLAKLLSLLITGSEDRPIFQFQHGGILCLDQVPEGNWLIRWALMPHLEG